MHYKRPIEVYSGDGQRVARYDSIKDAAKALNVAPNTIINYCGTQRPLNGQYLRYAAVPVPAGALYDWGPWMPFIQELIERRTSSIRDRWKRARAREYAYDFITAQMLRIKDMSRSPKGYILALMGYAWYDFWRDYSKENTVTLEDAEIENMPYRESILGKMPGEYDDLAELLLQGKSKRQICRTLKMTDDEYEEKASSLAKWILENWQR